MVHQQQMNKLLLNEKERLIEHLQKELLEIKLERDKFQQLLEKPRVEQLQWALRVKLLVAVHLYRQCLCNNQNPTHNNFTRITSTACTV